MKCKIELIFVPVTDVDRAIEFYVHKIGFTLDHDITVSDEVRFVQVTPPGSACSIMIDGGISPMPAGSQKGLQAVVEDADAVLKHMTNLGIEAVGVDEQPWGRFVYVADPDGNAWTFQQLLPQR